MNVYVQYTRCSTRTNFVIDMSAWVEFFRGKTINACRKIEKALEKKTIILSGLLKPICDPCNT